ncbi:hypothetical protein [Burkholderia gladioli]|uniref:hypothetical protein n=1 Tax=Burkholderia gladioli TaxID=28095 RepID=UPI003D25ADA1
MKRIHVAILAVMLSGSALAASPAPTRIRGTIAAVSASEITVHTTAGTDVQVALGANTKYLQVVKADLANIEPGSYIGTATKSTGREPDRPGSGGVPARDEGCGRGPLRLGYDSRHHAVWRGHHLQLDDQWQRDGRRRAVEYHRQERDDQRQRQRGHRPGRRGSG